MLHRAIRVPYYRFVRYILESFVDDRIRLFISYVIVRREIIILIFCLKSINKQLTNALSLLLEHFGINPVTTEIQESAMHWCTIGFSRRPKVVEQSFERCFEVSREPRKNLLNWFYKHSFGYRNRDRYVLKWTFRKQPVWHHLQLYILDRLKSIAHLIIVARTSAPRRIKRASFCVRLGNDSLLQ